MTDERPAHSPLGASGAERWMNCAGSVTLIQQLRLREGMEPSDEADWTKEGLAAHDASAFALVDGLDAWELVGRTFLGVLQTPELANPLQIYLDHCRSIDCGDEKWIEVALSSPIHPLFYGRVDFSAADTERLHVVDLKFGAGVMVEVENNAQTMYYAFLRIDDLERQLGKTMNFVYPVRLTIVQPRGFHPDGPVRSFDTTVGEIKAWVHGVLVPAMLATEYEGTLRPGDWCRFCPARIVCPALTGIFKAAATADAKHLVDTSDAALGENYVLVEAVKHYIKALEAETFARAQRGRVIPHTKLVRKKANRVWNEGASGLAMARFGVKAMTEPQLKSPAELEKLPEAGDWVKEFSHTPDTGLTLALDTDSRTAVNVVDPKDRFKDVVREQLTASVAQDSEW